MEQWIIITGDAEGIFMEKSIIMYLHCAKPVKKRL